MSEDDKEVTGLLRFLKALDWICSLSKLYLHRFHHLLPIWFSLTCKKMFMSAEDTDEAEVEVEAEAEAGDPAGMFQDHGLGPRQGHYLALLNARADALPRIQGLPGNVADASFTCLYKMTY